MIPRAEEVSQDVREKDDEFTFEYEHIKNVHWYDRVLLNRPLKVLIAVIFAAIVAPLLIYQFWFYPSVDSPPADGYSTGSCLLQRDTRLACGIGYVNEIDCHPQCCYDQQNGFCFHRVPSRFSYIMDRVWSENVTLQPRVSTVPYSFLNSVTSLKISVDELSPTHLSIHFYNAQFTKQPGRRIENKVYDYEVSSPEMNIVVQSQQGVIFNMLRGPLIASQNIWEISFKTTNESMYGLGEIPLTEGTIRVLYSHDKGESSIPLIYSKINDSYHGLLIDSSEPTEVTISNQNQMVVRSITNVGLKFHLFTGPQPEDVLKEVREYIGTFKNFEYWMLGAHVCSELSTNPDDAMTDLNDFISKASTQRLPYESHCGALPVTFNNDICKLTKRDVINKGAEVIKGTNKRFVPHISPYIRHNIFENSTEEDQNEKRNLENCSLLPSYERYMLKDPKTLEAYEGLVNDDPVYYLDYESLPEELMKRLWEFSTDVDGVVLENNWPIDESEKVHNETSMFLPYFNENFQVAFDRTPQWNISIPNDRGKYVYKHNLYGNSFTKATQRMFDKELPKWSTSQWMNGDIVINRQNIDTSWTALHRELVSMSLGGVSGHLFWSSPVCGDTTAFDIEKHSELCVKWYMASTFFPMIKIHSKATSRDPTQFVGTHRSYINNAINTRLSLLPYFYTVLQQGPLLRPMFFQYPTAWQLRDISTQFNVGNDLLIVPNLQPGQTHVHITMVPGTWYELWGGLRLNASIGEIITMSTTQADFLTLIRGGSIIPLQKTVQETAEHTRLISEFTLIVALECTNSTDNTTNCEATGLLYLSNNLTINLRADAGQILFTATGNGFEILCDQEALWNNNIQEINIYGLDDGLNNYDNHRRVTVTIDLCALKVMREVYFEFV